MTKERRFVSQPHSFDARPPLPDPQDDFHHVIDMALRVHTARNGKPHQLHLRGSGKHQAPDFNGADTAFEIQLRCQRNARKLVNGNVG